MYEQLSGRIRVLIVDDHAAVRRGLAAFVQAFDEFEIVALADGGEEALRLCPSTSPDVVLLDLVMPGLDGVQVASRLCACWPGVQIIGLMTFEDPDLAEGALAAGAVRCLLKNLSADELAAEIRAVHAGRSSGCAETRSHPAETQHRHAVLHPELRPREREVLGLMVKGLDEYEIAERLTVNPLTARFYIRNVLDKLDAADATDAVALALRHGLVNGRAPQAANN